MGFLCFFVILVSFGGLGGSRRAILGPMLGDVGCKMGPRWVQEGLESDFFAQLGVLMGILAPRWQDKASQDGSGVEEFGGSWRNLGRPASEAWPLESNRVRLGVRCSCLITAEQHTKGAAPDLKADASAAGPEKYA